MSNQVNIPKYYSLDQLNELKARFKQPRAVFSRTSVQQFLKAAKNEELHKEISPELKQFLGFLDSVIQTGGKTISGEKLSQGLNATFEHSKNPYNTMWQIRFINFISDVDMRKKIPYLETEEQKTKIASIKQRPAVDQTGESWNISQHHSLGIQSRSLEASFHVADNYPQATVVVERPDSNYSQVDDKELFKSISDLAQEIFTAEALQRVPDIQFNDDFFNQKLTDKEKIKTVNNKPLSQVFSKLISNSTYDSRTFIDLTHQQAKLSEMTVNYDSESSLLDLYLYRLNAFQDGPNIKAFYDDEGNQEPFEFGFDPKNYQGKEGRKKLALEAYEFFKTEFNENPQRFMDLVFHQSYQSEINFAKAQSEFMEAVKQIPIKQKSLDLNLAIVVDLKEQLAVYSLGDMSVIPSFHRDIHATSSHMKDLQRIQRKPNHQTPRLKLGNQKKAQDDSPNLAAIYDKDDVEAIILASKHLIKDRRKPCAGKQNKHYGDFFNSVLTPYIQDTKSIQRKKDAKLITDMISHSSENEDLGIYVLSHKISDDNENSVEIPDFEMPSGGDSDDNNPWQDSPIDSPDDLVLA